MKMRNIFVVATLLLSPTASKSMPPGGDAYMEREWQRRSDSLFVEAYKQSNSQLPTWWAMPDPTVTIKPSSGTEYVDPKTGHAYWDYSGYKYVRQGTYGKNTTDIPEIKIVPMDTVEKYKGFEKIK